ncbi:hypothetical protein [Streptomyces flaveolus]|uniref:hypothetical protein n=1 Tax=Streptomyces flaveolus TaxID=67297 RepID=UPI001989A5A6|nr:hypothetical protein GCM10010216_21130 [Streptomyces flaveolus]
MRPTAPYAGAPGTERHSLHAYNATFTEVAVDATLCGVLLSLPHEGVVALNRVTVNASVTTLLAGATGTTLLPFNEHAHFAGDRRAMLTYR